MGTTKKQNEQMMDYVDCSPEVLTAFEHGIKFGIAHSGVKPYAGYLHAGTADPRWTINEWRTALKNALEYAADWKKSIEESRSAKAGIKWDLAGFVKWYEHFQHEPTVQQVLEAMVPGPGTQAEKLEFVKQQAKAAKAGE
jgi:hypothetical protein